MKMRQRCLKLLVGELHILTIAELDFQTLTITMDEYNGNLAVEFNIKNSNLLA